MAVTTSTTIDPTVQPFLQYGLSEAQKLYQAGGPQYYPGQTYVSPSSATQTGLSALETRAMQGNPLLGSAQGQLQNTISGNYLSGNPFFQGAFAPAAQAATSQFNKAIADVTSAASKAGRYGSGAMQNLQGQASNQLAQQLANTAGTLAYQNYADERARQQAATLAAPQMAQADYQDIQSLLAAGQAREGYTGAQQQADIARFNFLQNAPQQNLANYLNAVYGNPLGRSTTQTQTGSQDTSTLQNLLGLGSIAAGIYKSPDLVSDIKSGWNWLSSGWGG